MTLEGLWEQAVTIWVSGGWAMIALAVDGLLLFTVGMNLWFKLRGRGYRRLRERTWRGWVTRPEERRGPVGRVLDFVMEASSLKDLSHRFAELHSTELSPFSRDLRFMKRCVNSAPLLGLLGTVTGMLTTFHALATGTGGQKTMDMVAGGISEALITTETGLIIALPGLILQHHLTRERDRYEAFLAHVESACAQALVVWQQVRKHAGGRPLPPAARSES